MTDLRVQCVRPATGSSRLQ